MMLRAAALLLLGGGLGMLGGALAADPAAGAYMYGIDEEASTGTFWIQEFNPVKQEEAIEYDTGIVSTGSDADANALAFDVGRNQLLFVAGEDLPSLKLWVFDVTTKTLSVVGLYTDIGLTTPASRSDVLNNAAFFDDAYWYFENSATAVTKVQLTYTNGLPTAVASATNYPTDDPNIVNNYRSDIAIDARTATLYGCGEPLFSVGLSNLAAPLPVTTIGGPLDSYQCAFNADFSTLWGYESGSGQGWFTVDLATGAWNPFVWESNFSPSDLGGSSFFGVNGPECSTQPIQHAVVKASAPRTAKRGGMFRYRARVKNGSKNKTISAINNLRLEVSLPPEVSFVYSSTNPKQGTSAIVGPSSVVWRPFNLTKRATARFGLKLRVASTAVPRQLLTLNTTLYQEFEGAPFCPKRSSLSVRVK